MKSTTTNERESALNKTNMPNSIEYSIAFNGNDGDMACLSFKTPIGEVHNIEFRVKQNIFLEALECLADHLKVMVDMERKSAETIEMIIEEVITNGIIFQEDTSDELKDYSLEELKDALDVLRSEYEKYSEEFSSPDEMDLPIFGLLDKYSSVSFNQLCASIDMLSEYVDGRSCQTTNKTTN